MPNADQAVEALIRDFATSLRGLLRDQLSEEVTAAIQAALDHGQMKRGKLKGKPGQRAALRPQTGKRTPEQIEKLATQLLSHIDKNPEQRAEQIAQSVKLTTGELVLPIKRLLADKKIKAKGKARGTTYTAVK